MEVQQGLQVPQAQRRGRFCFKVVLAACFSARELFMQSKSSHRHLCSDLHCLPVLLGRRLFFFYALVIDHKCVPREQQLFSGVWW